MSKTVGQGAKNIAQVQLHYMFQEDRLQLDFITGGHQAFRFYLTRRITKQLWPKLLKVMKSDPSLAAFNNLETKKAAMAFQHEAAMSTTKVEKSTTQQKEKPVAKKNETPLGDEPLLVTLVRVTESKQKKLSLGLYDAKSMGLEIGSGNRVLNYLYQILLEVVAKTDWDMQLEAVKLSDGGAGGKDPSQLN